ncbi:hypothetical protein STAS_01160 [Striga asiatica]|uniref:Uncharacterized protein n=1 Tax=Striga asiatica TaxID=4170 RepID=A0A5A7NZ88_STRAF|nr:hypothetical protein STAS_01160 [Striga asiatica]
MLRAATSCARAAISGVGNVPSQIRDFLRGSRISETHLPQLRIRTPRYTGCFVEELWPEPRLLFIFFAVSGGGSSAEDENKEIINNGINGPMAVEGSDVSGWVSQDSLCNHESLPPLSLIRHYLVQDLRTPRILHASNSPKREESNSSFHKGSPRHPPRSSVASSVIMSSSSSLLGPISR